ncbi:hypothetical protein B296_00024623 [Ensete ventricosum]|uniref:Expansin n=1 Tax=Ensete ventricosum TaxID=4639 RepID=A0A426ZJR8_ENSVE|nr:hypothetical protein B296_00024623 [Ensete ventricosum]
MVDGPCDLLRRRVCIGDHGSVSPAQAKLHGGTACPCVLPYHAGGACGYGIPFSTGYGTKTVELSSVLFKDGFACGSCCQIRGTAASACYGGYPIITVTATNLYPPKRAQPSDDGGGATHTPLRHVQAGHPEDRRLARRNRADHVP